MSSKSQSFISKHLDWVVCDDPELFRTQIDPDLLFYVVFTQKPGVWRCSWWLHLHIPWAQTGSVDAKWCEMNPVHIWIELRLKSTQPVQFCSRDGHLKTVRTMSEKRVMRVIVSRWVASVWPLYIPKTASLLHNISIGMHLTVEVSSAVASVSS